MSHDVFISYSSKDKLMAHAACVVLESQAIRCWIAPRDVIPGKSYAEQIVEAIGGAKAMVLIFSSSANHSEDVHREVQGAFGKGVPVIPFRIEDVKPTGALEYFLASQHWLDALTPPREAQLRHLSETISNLLGRPLRDSERRDQAAGSATKQRSSGSSEGFSGKHFGDKLWTALPWKTTDKRFPILVGVSALMVLLVLVGISAYLTGRNSSTTGSLAQVAEITAALRNVDAHARGADQSDKVGPLPRDAVRELAESLAALSDRSDPSAGIDTALQKLREGDPVPILSVVSAQTGAHQKSDTDTARWLRGLGLIQFYKDSRAALDIYQRSIQLDPESWIAWYQIARLRERLGVPNAIDAVNRVVDLAKHTNNNDAFGSAYAALGLIAHDGGRFDEAVSNFQKSRGYFLISGARVEAASATNAIARSFYAKGNYSQASISYQDALSMDKAIGDHHAIAADYIGLADVLSRSEEKQYDQAIEYDKLALSESGTADDLYLTGLADFSIAKAYMVRQRSGDLELAEIAEQKALVADEKLGNLLGTSYDLGGFGNLAAMRGEYPQAENYYLQALKFAKSGAYKFVEAVQERGLGKVYWDEKKPIAALDAFRRAHELDSNSKQYALYAAIDQEWIGDTYSSAGQNSEACAAWQDAKQLYQQPATEDAGDQAIRRAHISSTQDDIDQNCAK